MGLTLSKQIEYRLATLALLETLVTADPLPDTNTILSHVRYFRIQKDVGNFIRDIAESEGSLAIKLVDDWKSMARTQIAAFTADTSIDLMKDTFLQHFQAELSASISVPPSIGATAITERAKTFTETFIDTLVDDVLKKSISPGFYNILYPTGKASIGNLPKVSTELQLKGTDGDNAMLLKELKR